MNQILIIIYATVILYIVVHFSLQTKAPMKVPMSFWFILPLRHNSENKLIINLIPVYIFSILIQVFSHSNRTQNKNLVTGI